MKIESTTIEWIDLHDSILSSFHFDATGATLHLVFAKARASVAHAQESEIYVDVVLEAKLLEDLTLFSIRDPDFVYSATFRRGGRDLTVVEMLTDVGAVVEDADVRISPFAAVAFRAGAVKATCTMHVSSAASSDDGPLALPASHVPSDVRFPRRWPDTAQLLELGFRAHSEHDELVVRFEEVSKSSPRCIELRGVGIERLDVYRLTASSQIRVVYIDDGTGRAVDLSSIPPTGLQMACVRIQFGMMDAILEWRPRRLAVRIAARASDLGSLHVLLSNTDST